MPQQQRPAPQPQAPQTPNEFKDLESIKNNVEAFNKLDENKKRQYLGNIIFPKVKEIVKDDAAAPKITGMLIDFEVFEVTDILDLIEDEAQLKEQCEEAKTLLVTNE